MSDAYLPLKRYFEMSGRSGRREYWLWCVFSILVTLICTALDMFLGLGGYSSISSDPPSASFVFEGGWLASLWSLGTIIPTFTVLARRLHDIDLSAWWIAVSLVPLLGLMALFVMTCIKGSEGRNRFGPHPRAVANVASFQLG